MKNREIVKKWVEDKFREIAKAMKFGILNLQFIHQERDHRTKSSSSLPEHVGLIAINVVLEYHRAEIFITPTALEMAENPDEHKDLIDAMVHELSHIHVAPLTNVAEKRHASESDIREAVENVTEAFATYIREWLELTSNVYVDKSKQLPSKTAVKKLKEGPKAIVT